MLRKLLLIGLVTSFLSSVGYADTYHRSRGFKFVPPNNTFFRKPAVKPRSTGLMKVSQGPEKKPGFMLFKK